MRLAIAADHRGFPQKAPVMEALRADGHDVLDLGTSSNAPVDYPDQARAVGEAVRTGRVEAGVLICGSGAGVSIAANKLRGVRAALCHDLFTARQAREDDDANVICLGALVVDVDAAIALVRAFVGARFSHAERHERRLAKVLALEAREMARPRRSRTRPRTDEAPEVLTALHRLESLRAVPRLWARDASLWSDDEEVRAAIRTRLGWLDLDRMRPHLSRLLAFGQAVSAEEVRDVVLLGMGGSSLAAEVFATAFPRASGAPRLTVLDTTDPAAIRTVRDGIAIDRTLFIVSSKSGTTAETLALYRYFWSEVEATGAAAGRHFVAITDPGTPLERLATDRGFRETFLNPPDIGGRFSALSFFGLVPAALLAIDPTRLLDAAEAMAQACRDEGPLVEHPALGLAARLGGLGRAGRDKVTLVLSSSIRTFGDWLEQLIMESTGKQGVGLVVVQDEPDASPESYGPDRVFVGITHGSDPALERTLDRREAEGHPTLRFQVTDPVALAGEFLRWEIATAGVAILLGVNPFDEPNVASAKEATHAALATFQDMAHLPEWPTNDVDDLIRMLAGTRPPDWIALLAYLTPRADTLAALQRLRRLVLERTRCATTLGFGPRYLHSTGQLMKGGPPTAAMLLFTGKDRDDLPIPGQVYGFSTLKRAQALGDLGALRTAHRRIVWIDLEGDDGEALERLAATVDRRLAPATGETGG